MKENMDIVEQTSNPDGVLVLRTVNQNQMKLIVLADQKANILIGIIAVIFTILFTKSEQLFNGNDLLIVPFVGFSSIEMIALLLAFTVIIPKNKSQHQPDCIKDSINPLYFGCFTQFDEEEYISFLSTEVNNDQAIKTLLIRDIYHLGIVLKKKYTLLKYAYIFSIAGAMLPFILFLIMYFG